MTARITFTFGDDGSQEVTIAWDDFARAVHAGLAHRREVDGPRSEDFLELCSSIAQVSHLIQHLEIWKELAIVAADGTSGDADRRMLTIAAAMPPSRLYRILESHGRPKDRKDTTQRDTLTQAVGAGGPDATWDAENAVKALVTAGHTVTDKRARQLLRDLRRDRVLIKADATRAIYRPR